MSFFDNDEDDGYPVHSRAGPSRPARPTNRAGRAQSAVSATTSAGAGSRSFLSRLESTVSPGRSDPYGGHEYDDDMLEEEVHRAEGRLDELELDEEGGAEPDDEDESELDDVRKMGRVWVKERGTVDLMSWEGDLIDTLFDKLEQQVRGLGVLWRGCSTRLHAPIAKDAGPLFERIAARRDRCAESDSRLTAQQKMVDTLRSDPQTSEEEHFKLVLVQTEMERVKFVIRSYVRTRLHKVSLRTPFRRLH